MGPHDTPAPSPAFLAAFAAHADANAAMTFDRFMELALYHPEVGYYRAKRKRVGYAPGTDFFTAGSSGPVFGGLIAATCATLLGGRDASDFAFVEIGAEPSAPGILAGVPHPFGSSRTVPLGEEMALEGNCVVFSNELFDAQPCRRFVFRKAGWRELGVRLQDGAFAEVELPIPGGAPGGLPALPTFSPLPPSPPEGAIIDAPLAAAALLGKIAALPWTGLFVACDYGKTWAELSGETPGGTVRAYHRHRQSNDLLARPGEQDLTCHVCWDWLIEALTRSGFPTPVVESQESFLVRHAGAFIAKTAEAEASRFSSKKLSLLQLLHPSHMGQKFQVLHALRN